MELVIMERLGLGLLVVLVVLIVLEVVVAAVGVVALVPLLQGRLLLLLLLLLLVLVVLVVVWNQRRQALLVRPRLELLVLLSATVGGVQISCLW